ncbi:hypothetical protein DVH24_038073 [Malus domestica]|uniref:RING-type E3 ubiquitin transferase n=1 Tax=Malus domestica TaxID=3750 RepID=A0A498K6A9_MALDO|nr:hypothetical protein DVH24_038073 [Malus domestica]
MKNFLIITGTQVNTYSTICIITCGVPVTLKNLSKKWWRTCHVSPHEWSKMEKYLLNCTLERHRTFVPNLFVCPSSGWLLSKKSLVHKWSSSSSSSRQCPICLEDFVECESCRVLVTCKRTFHLICIDGWLKSQLTCPLCRNFIFIYIILHTHAIKNYIRRGIFAVNKAAVHVKTLAVHDAL